MKKNLTSVDSEAPRWQSLWDSPEFEALNLGPSARHKNRILMSMVRSLDLHGDFLDVGCGRGYLLSLLRDRASSLTGIDLAPRALELTRQAMPEASTILLNVEKETLHQKFDAIFCTNALEEMENDRAALANMREMLQPGGVLLVVTPHRMKYWTEKDKLGGNFRRYEKAHLVALLEELQFDVVKVRTWGWPLYRLWYGGMTKVDQNQLWKRAGKVAKLSSEVAYRLLFFDDIFAGGSEGSFIFIAARRPFDLASPSISSK